MQKKSTLEASVITMIPDRHTNSSNQLDLIDRKLLLGLLLAFMTEIFGFSFEKIFHMIHKIRIQETIVRVIEHLTYT